MKVITAAKYCEPEFARGLVKAVPKFGEKEAEYFQRCKYVDESHTVWFYDGRHKEKKRVEAKPVLSSAAGALES